MNILLVNPNNAIPSGNGWLPLGIAYIAAVIKKEFQEHEVEILDLQILKEGSEYFSNYLRKKTYDLIGFTATTPLIDEAYRLAKVARQCTNAIIIAGGVHPSILPDECLRQEIDIVVRGEGEATIVDVCRNLNSLHTVQGISYKDGEKIIHNEDRPLIEDIDTIPQPAIELFPDLKKYHGSLFIRKKNVVSSMFTSRGCLYDCTNCNKSIFRNQYRMRTPDNVMEEWEKLVKQYHVKEFAIFDDCFAFNPDRVHAICEKIIKRKCVVPWSCQNGIRVTSVSLELLRAMKKAGCYLTGFGIESANTDILHSLKKKIDKTDIIRAFDLARKVGIETIALIMIGNIGDTEETINETIEFAKKLNPSYSQISIAVPYPGTQFYNVVEKEGVFLSHNWSDYFFTKKELLFEHGKVKKELVEQMYAKAYRDYYLRPRYIIKKLFNLNSYRVLPLYIKVVKERLL